MLITARILLTLAALGFSAITIIADLNKTHASNPLWTPHARFHVVWQVLSYSGIGLIALYLIWAGGPMQTERLYLAAALAVAVYGGFFGAVFSRPVYGGGLFDANGYPSFQAPIGPRTWLWDVNVTIFTLTSAVLLAGIIAVVASYRPLNKANSANESPHMTIRKSPEQLRSYRWLGPGTLRAFGHRSRLKQFGYDRED